MTGTAGSEMKSEGTKKGKKKEREGRKGKKGGEVWQHIEGGK